MRRKQGFTLIELLAVIVILAVIALIATPIIIGIIDDAKVSAAKQSANGVLESARLYHQSSLLKDITFDGTTNEYPEVSKLINGKQPENENAKVLINKEGEIALAVVYNGLCFVKSFNTPIQEGKKTDSCTVEGSLAITEDYAIVNFYDWDNTLIGSTIVPKGDARGYVNEYVLTHFVHPDLQTNKNYSSLERKDSYRGEYPYVSPTEGDTFTNGKDYPLTNGLDYVFYGKDKDKDYPYVSGWVGVTLENLKTTRTNIGNKLAESDVAIYNFKDIMEEVISVKAVYKKGPLALGSTSVLTNHNISYNLRGSDQVTVKMDFEHVYNNSNVGIVGMERLFQPILVINSTCATTYYPIFLELGNTIFASIDFMEKDEGKQKDCTYKVTLQDMKENGPWLSADMRSREISLVNPAYEGNFYALKDSVTKYHRKEILNWRSKMNTSVIGKVLDFRINTTGGAISVIDLIGAAGTSIEKAVLASLENNQLDKYGISDITWFQIQYAILNNGNYVSKEEAEIWCKANCSWL